MHTHRANIDADTDVTCWVRNRTGRVDLSAEALTVPVYAYGHECELMTLDATGTTEGQATFTVTADQTHRYFPAGLYRFAVKADGSVVYAGLLEVV